jgi:hypothetical protein
MLATDETHFYCLFNIFHILPCYFLLLLLPSRLHMPYMNGTTQQFTMEEAEARERVTASHRHRIKASRLDCWLVESLHFTSFFS